MGKPIVVLPKFLDTLFSNCTDPKIGIRSLFLPMYMGESSKLPKS